MPKRKANWLSRSVAAPGPFLSLCLSQEEFDVVLNDLGIASRPWIPSTHAHATTHTLRNNDGDLACVVCLKTFESKVTPIQAAALLVHESVHVWIRHLEYISETEPGEEQQAYGIQFISQTLMEEYAHRMGVKV